MKTSQYQVFFVPRIPDEIENDQLYICLECNVAIHKCACGCGEKVVTPIDPRGWTLVYDGETISLSPSIGNWSYKCKSHYFIRKNKVIWAQTRWDDESKKATTKAKKQRKQKKKVWSNLFKKD